MARRTIAWILAVNTALLGVRIVQEVASAQTRVATQNGDTNGDGFLDLSDAVYLLEHMFLGGPPPAAIAQSGELDARVAALEAKLSHVNMTEIPDGQGGMVPTLRVEGVNLQVVNGEGETGTANGTGNLVVGYNWWNESEDQPRTGSHNLIVGDQNSHTSWGAIVAGTRNRSDARFASVLGGKDKVADEEWERLGAVHDDAEEALSYISIVEIPGGSQEGTEETPGRPEACYIPADMEWYRTIRFTGVNLQLVNGQPKTWTDWSGHEFCGHRGTDGTNGLGNLFLGYVEYMGESVGERYSPQALGSVRGGSHNIIVGGGNCWPGENNVLIGKDMNGTMITKGRIFSWDFIDFESLPGDTVRESASISRAYWATEYPEYYAK